MENNSIVSKSTPLLSGIAFFFGSICIGASVFGLFWLSRIIPGIYQTLTNNGFSFMSNSFLFHLIWAVFFISLLVTGIKLLISAIKKRNKDLVSGLTLYFLGASLVVIGLFYLIFQQYTYALITIIVGALCIYLEGATELA
ncbi:MAG: hypothetical protein AAF304_04545 [Pseudomonadota bacterium]